jgi:thioredoxin 1
MKRILLVLSAIFVFSGTAFAAGAADSEPLIRKALASGKPSLVDFGAGYCRPCKKMKPILEGLQKEYSEKANVLFVDVKEEQDMPEKYRIVMIPTQVFYNAQGKEVKRHMGFMDKDDILKVFREIGVK